MTGAVANLSPTLLGFIYGQATSSNVAATDAVAASSSDLVNLLSTGVCFGYISCAFCFAMAARSSPPPSSLSTEKAKGI